MNTDASKKQPFRPGSLVRVAHVCELLGVSRSTLYRLVSEEIFPEPVKLGARAIRWRLETIEAWRDALRR
ncbi:MAG: AlpA family phage regulatory protein [Betaproteobacteria bacterium]